LIVKINYACVMLSTLYTLYLILKEHLNSTRSKRVLNLYLSDKRQAYRLSCY